MSYDLRPYGPGKFDHMVDAYVYGLSLDGWCDEETGEADGPGWYGLIRGCPLEDPIPHGEAETLTADEVAFLRAQAGAIVCENSDGFVYVEYYETPTEMDRMWAAVVKDVGEWYGEGDDD